MLPPGLQTPRQVTLHYDSLYDALIDSGQAVPFVYPWAGIGAFIVLGFLLVDYRWSSGLRWLRYPIFAFLFLFQSWCIVRTRAKHPAGALGVGLLSAWGVLWVASIMVFNDCQSDFQRINYPATVSSSKEAPEPNGIPNGDSIISNTQDHPATMKQATPVSTEKLVWQGYPTNFHHRLEWVADVFCNFRGVGWSWQTSGIPPLPKRLEQQHNGTARDVKSDQITMSRTGIRRISNRAYLLKITLVRLAIGFLALDIVKVAMNNDAYFWGYMDAAPPKYLPIFIQNSYALLKCYRLSIGLLALYSALSEAFNLGPLFFCGILGPQRIGICGEPWMNPPDMFGSYKCVLDQGLAGWWGGWWHQTFRFGFEAPANRLLTFLRIEKRSSKGRLISLLMAFFLSGCVHAAGSYTMLGDTRPLMGPMRFFLLQPVGIMLQVYTAQLLSDAGVLQKTPQWVKQLGNFLVVHVWFYMTASLLVDDFAKGGCFLFEPIAFSPLRALGLGAKDDTWYCWWDGIVFWRAGKHWWDTGIAV